MRDARMDSRGSEEPIRTESRMRRVGCSSKVNLKLN